MKFYEVRVGKQKPICHDRPSLAFEEADYMALCTKKGTRVSVYAVSFCQGPAERRRLSLARYRKVLSILRRASATMAEARVVSVRECHGLVQEEEAIGPTRLSEDGASYLASDIAEYEPSTSLTIDDSRYSVAFYDVYYTRKIQVRQSQFSPWVDLWETPAAKPQPHVMDC